MRIGSLTALIALISVPTLALIPSCSGSQDQDNGDVLQSDNNESANNVGSDDANESNNAGDGEEDATGNQPGSQINNDTSGIEDGLAANTPPPVNASSGNSVPTNSANSAPTKAPPAPSDAAPLAGGRVRYVKQGGVQIVSSPKGGQPIRQLEQGDHPLTWEENGFLKLANGMYVPVDAMSDQGVPHTTVPQSRK